MYIFLNKLKLFEIELFLFSHSSDNGFLEFLHEYCKEKCETCSKFKTSFVVTKNIKIGFWPASPVKNRHKLHYHREFTCKRDITLADPWRKIGCSLRYKYLLWKFLLQIFFILHQLHFHANKVNFNAFFKKSYILDPWILLWKTPYRMLFSNGSSQLLRITFMFLFKTKLV